MADKSKIGRIYHLKAWEVERGKIRELVESIGDMNPIYVDREAAVRSGYRDTPVPPTFATLPMMSAELLLTIIKDLDIDYARLLHGEEDYEYLNDMYPGDLLSGTITVSEIDEKTGRSGNMNLIRLEFLYKNQEDQAVLAGRSLFIERKG